MKKLFLSIVFVLFLTSCSFAYFEYKVVRVHPYSYRIEAELNNYARQGWRFKEGYFLLKEKNNQGYSSQNYSSDLIEYDIYIMILEKEFYKDAEEWNKYNVYIGTDVLKSKERIDFDKNN